MRMAKVMLVGDQVVVEMRGEAEEDVEVVRRALVAARRAWEAGEVRGPLVYRTTGEPFVSGSAVLLWGGAAEEGVQAARAELEAEGVALWRPLRAV